jgi:hypothetical protein
MNERMQGDRQNKRKESMKRTGRKSIKQKFDKRMKIY